MGDADDDDDKKKKTTTERILPKKPQLSKAERRALQESQRAAKTASNKKKDATHHQPAPSLPKEEGSKQTAVPNSKTPGLFSHLPPYRDVQQLEQEFSGVKLGGNSDLHPEILALGFQYATGSIRGGNARCKAMLHVFQTVLSDYEFGTNNNTGGNNNDFRQELDHALFKPAFQYWTTQCRSHSVTMGNAFTFLKLAVANLDRDMNVNDAKKTLIETMDAYIQERIVFADKAISKHANSKIVDGDVICTYGYSEVISVLLKNASSSGKSFRVIIVDSRPLLEGKLLLQHLMLERIECTYVLFNSLSYVMMRDVTKVFLGAAALMSDGSILSRVGTSGVALMAKSNNVPVLICCETYKISNRVQLESITFNELGDPEEVIVLRNERKNPNLTLLNILYDLTPSDFVSGIVTEMGILPPTSVAVLLREMNPQDNDSAFKGGTSFYS